MPLMTRTALVAKIRNLSAITFVCLLLNACGGGSSSQTAIEPPPPLPPPDEGLTVTTASGDVVGFQEGMADAFLGIPYARPPVGDLRWQPPAPPAVWQTPLDASAFSSPCPQPSDALGQGQPGAPVVTVGDEDCLYLNVWRPSNPTGSPLPVLVFIHGGGNFAGSAADTIGIFLNTTSTTPIYDGAKLSALSNIIVVTLNYRLGPLGYLNTPVLASASPTGTAGNYGILDQIAALKWVRDNIAAFGGDPDRVLVAGQSGGARDTCVLLASPQATGLFSRVAMHSGPCSVQTASEADGRAQLLLDELGCSTAADPLACLYSQTTDQLVLAVSSRPRGFGDPAFLPSIDGYIIPSQPYDTIANAMHNAVPVILGSNSAEYANRFSDIPADQYPLYLANLVPPGFASAALATYPLSDYPTATDAYVAALSDRNIVCSVRRVARSLVANQSAPVYRYDFRQVLAAPEAQAAGAYHGLELLYLFQHMDNQDFVASADDQAVADLMGHRWGSFAAQADPNDGSLPVWAAYDLNNESYLAIQPQSTVATHLRQTQCDFWDSIIGQ